MTTMNTAYNDARAAVDFFNRTARHFEDTLAPGIYGHLEEEMVAQGRRHVTSRMLERITIQHYPSRLMTLKAWRECLQHQLDPNFIMTKVDPGRRAALIAAAGVYSNWRLTQQALSFDRTLAAEILDAQAGDNLDDVGAMRLPVDHLRRLPFRTFAIVPNCPERWNLKAVLVHIQDSSEMHPAVADRYSGTVFLDFVPHYHDQPDGTFGGVVGVMLFPGLSVDETVEKTLREGSIEFGIDLDTVQRDVIRQLMRATIPFLMYLAADNREIDGEVRTEAPPPKSTKRGVRIFPPERPLLVPVGVRVGAALRQYRQAPAVPESAGPTGRTVAPHLRKAHWHSFWTGPRTDPAQRRLRLQFLPSTPVNLGPGAIAPVVRPVK